MSLRERLADRSITIDVTDEAKHFLANQGYDPVYGVRPLKRYLQRALQTQLGRKLMAGDIQDGSCRSKPGSWKRMSKPRDFPVRLM